MAIALIHTPSSPIRARKRLDERTIHVWSARLDLPAERVEQLERSLTAEERRRGPRRRLARAQLRHVLAGYADVPPSGLELVGSVDQKPRLAGHEGSADLQFNVSHSGDILVIAVGRRSEIGVDVERVRPVHRADAVARRAFTDGERERIAALPHEQRVAAFFNCWTRKEACVKATGHGVWAAFYRWEVSVEPGEPARVLIADGESADAAGWSLVHLEPARTDALPEA